MHLWPMRNQFPPATRESMALVGTCCPCTGNEGNLRSPAEGPRLPGSAEFASQQAASCAHLNSLRAGCQRGILKSGDRVDIEMQGILSLELGLHATCCRFPAGSLVAGLRGSEC